jgi:chromosome segregation ATPase
MQEEYQAAKDGI